MRKVLIVHNHYRIRGGEDTVAENEAELLRSHGYTVFLYERDNAESPLPFSMLFSLRSYLEIRRLIRKEGIGLVHVHNPFYRISPAVYYAAVKESVPVIQTMHNFRLLCPAAVFFRDGRICEDCCRKGSVCALRHGCYRGSRILTALVALMNAVHLRTGIYRKVNFICLTEFNKQKLLLLNKQKQRIDPDRIFVKPNFTQPGPERRASEGYYIVIGRIERLKGSALIAKAFAENGKRILFVGDGEQKEKLEHFIGRHGAKNIECLGALPHEKTMELLSAAEALIAAPQWYETFGMTVIEAYSCGVPVIAADFGNVGSLVRDGETGVLFPNSAEGLRLAVERFESLDKEKLSRQAFSEYREKYSPEVNYEKLKEIYDSL